VANLPRNRREEFENRPLGRAIFINDLGARLLVVVVCGVKIALLITRATLPA